MTKYSEIMEEIKQEISNGETLEDVRDRAHELVDNYVPVYNNRIVEEWQVMPSEYDNRGSEELGHDCANVDIIKLMSADLYLYYTDLVTQVLNDFEEEGTE